MVDQLWAEAYRLFQQGETLYLPPEIERMAEAEQTEALESDVREGMIAEYLEKLLPEDWDRMDLSERRRFLRGDLFTGGSRTGTVRRTVVSAVEIWAECFGKEPHGHPAQRYLRHLRHAHEDRRVGKVQREQERIHEARVLRHPAVLRAQVENCPQQADHIASALAVGLPCAMASRKRRGGRLPMTMAKQGKRGRQMRAYI